MADYSGANESLEDGTIIHFIAISFCYVNNQLTVHEIHEACHSITYYFMKKKKDFLI